jgi:hypothetical protein
MNDRATLTRLEECTADAWRKIAGEYPAFVRGLPDRLIAHPKPGEGDDGGDPEGRGQRRDLWMVPKQGVFHGYPFFHQLCMDRNPRDQLKGDPHYERTAGFCALYDNPACDPNAQSLPIAEFGPMLRRGFAQPRNSTYKAAVSPAG